MRTTAFMLFAVTFSSFGSESEIQRALIERDQRTAEFAAGVRGDPIDRRARAAGQVEIEGARG